MTDYSTQTIPALAMYMGWGIAFSGAAVLVVEVDVGFVGLLAWSGVMTLRYLLEHVSKL